MWLPGVSQSPCTRSPSGTLPRPRPPGKASSPCPQHGSAGRGACCQSQPLLGPGLPEITAPLRTCSGAGRPTHQGPSRCRAPTHPPTVLRGEPLFPLSPGVWVGGSQPPDPTVGSTEPSGDPPTSCGDGLGARHEIRCQSPERWLLRLQRLKTETLGCGGRGRGARGAGQRRGRGPVSCSVPRPELWTRRHPQPKPSRLLGLRKPTGHAVSCLGLDLLPPEAEGAWPVRTSLPVYAQ